MNCQWRSTTRVFIVFVMVVGLVYKFYNAPTDFRNFAVHCWPTIVLELCHFQRVINFAVRYVEFPSRIIGTAFAVHVFHEDVIILDFIIGPIAWTLPGPIPDLQSEKSSEVANIMLMLSQAILTSDIITKVVTLCSETILQKSPIVFSSGS